MKALKPIVAVYLVVTAVWVVIHFAGHTFSEDHSSLDDHSSETPSVEEDRVITLDLFMAIAFLLTMAMSFQAKRAKDRQSPPPDGWLFSNLFFYWTVLVAVPFFANWFASLGHTDDGILWIFIETAGPLTWTIQAIRLWPAELRPRSLSSPTRRPSPGR